MPILDEELTLNAEGQPPRFIVLDAGATVRDALAKLPRRRSQRAYIFVAVPLDGGAYLLPRWIEVELLALAAGRDITGLRIADLPGLLGQIDPAIEVDAGGKKIRASELPRYFARVPALEQADLSLSQARAARDGQPGQRILVLRGGQVHGLFFKEMLSADHLPADPFASGPAVLSADGPPAVLSPTAATPEAQPVDNRRINGWIEGWSRDTPGSPRAWRQIGRDEPLLLGQTYELKIEVDVPRTDALISGGDVGAIFQRTELDEVAILIELVVDESAFRLYEELPNARLIVPRQVRPSKNRVTFSLEPLKTGQHSIKVICYALNELFLEREVKVTVTDRPEQAVPGGQPGAITVQNRGLTMAAALSRTPRHPDNERISLYIDEQQPGVYKFILAGANAMRATVRLTPEALQQALVNARKEFHDRFILRKFDGVWIYLEPDPSIPSEVYRADLEELAFIGRDLYQTLFYGRLGESTAEAKAMGDCLRDLSREHTLDIKIVSDRFTFPWQLLYDRPDDGEPVDPDGFWGFKHIIQFMPEFSAGTQVNFGTEIVVQGKLPLAVVYDERIDAQFGFPVIAEQRATFGANADLEVKELTKSADVISLLRDQNAPPVIYFYVHNESLLPAEVDKKRPELPIGTDAARITTSEGELLLRDIKRRASVELPKFKNTPLIFLNACQGAELVPGQFDGVLPYFMQRGARGAIGTEVNTPVNFAARFGAELIAEFAKGEKTLGELLLERRRFYRDTHNNIMGLIYACYSNGDTIVQKSSS
ncbi:MAG TPA: CHAT domain-containing protein [Roseiflexaceae bacterium]|nr:CHAT domain-containing protein [Roseiflexaceae bacterium]